MPDDSSQDDQRAVQAVERAIEVFRNGGIVILVDDEDRENEGDFAMAAEDITPEAVNFMTKVARGMLCVALDSATCGRLDLHPQSQASGRRRSPERCW